MKIHLSSPRRCADRPAAGRRPRLRRHRLQRLEHLHEVPRRRPAHGQPDGSGDTASGADNGQWTEFELRIKATISKQVEAGVRLQSRSPAGYWTDFGFAEGFRDQRPRAANS
jgi:hypothetical protein